MPQANRHGQQLFFANLHQTPPVLWLTLARYGIPVGGPRIEDLSLNVDPQRLCTWKRNNLLGKRAKTLHIGTANYCWFADPGKALCLKLAGTPTATKPLAGMCDSTRCPQATHHSCHRPIWEDQARTTTAFIAGLSRRQTAERARLHTELDRIQQVIDGAQNPAPTATEGRR